MLKHFLTFGDSKKYKKQVDRICKEANELQVFDYIWGVTDEQLKKDTLFWKRHGEWVLQNSRGYGYWIWKPYLIWTILHCRMNYGDILVYADSGCTINANGKQRIYEYFDMVDRDTNGFFCFELSENCTIKKWTKGDLIAFLKAEEYKNKSQRVGGIIVIKKTPVSVNFMRNWYELCCYTHLLDDSISKIPNDPEFKEHRHDQSIFSILSYKYNILSIRDETYPKTGDWNEPELKNKPILSKRNK